MTIQNLSTKLALIFLPLVGAGILTNINTIGETFGWQRANAVANQTAADAARTTADAAQKETINKLIGVLETARAEIEASRLQSRATETASQNLAHSTIVASQYAAEGQFKAAQEVAKAENSEYDQITKRFFGNPVEKTDDLNTKIIRLKNELEAGIDTKTSQPLTLGDRMERQNKIRALELEHKIQSEITSKNWDDAIRMMTGATAGLFSGMGSFYPNSNTPPAPPRRIIQEP